MWGQRRVYEQMQLTTMVRLQRQAQQHSWTLPTTGSGPRRTTQATAASPSTGPQKRRNLFGVRWQLYKQEYFVSAAGHDPSSADPEVCISSASSSLTVTEVRGANELKESSFEYRQQNAVEIIALIQQTIQGQENREQELEQRIDRFQKQALQNWRGSALVGNRATALRSMKKANQVRYELDKVAAAIEAMERQVLEIESAMETAKVLRAMHAGSIVLHSLYEGVPAFSSPADTNMVDLSIQVMDQINEASAYAATIQTIFSEPLHDAIDDDELMSELNVLVRTAMEPPAPLAA